MKEVVTIQVGQCGNQVGLRWWDLLQQEHSAPGAAGDVSALSTFFRAAEGERSSSGGGAPAPDDARAPFAQRFRARAVLVDMEEGVVAQLARSPLGALFDSGLQLTDVSGAGNNWACGYAVYGPRYRDGALELVRRSLEACDSPQAFLVLHSTGGGTGSGFGSYLLEQLEDNFAELFRFTASLLPSRNDDVITSPYNALMATARLVDHADAVLPIDNQCLLDLVDAVAKVTRGAGRSLNGSGGGGGGSADVAGSDATALRRGGVSAALSLTSLGPGRNAAAQASSSGREWDERRSMGRAGTAGASDSAASGLFGATAAAAATSPAPTAAIPPELRKMLEQADAVLDAVTHGLVPEAAAPRLPPQRGGMAARGRGAGATSIKPQVPISAQSDKRAPGRTSDGRGGAAAAAVVEPKAVFGGTRGGMVARSGAGSSKGSAGSAAVAGDTKRSALSAPARGRGAAAAIVAVPARRGAAPPQPTAAATTASLTVTSKQPPVAELKEAWACRAHVGAITDERGGGASERVYEEAGSGKGDFGDRDGDSDGGGGGGNVSVAVPRGAAAAARRGGTAFDAMNNLVAHMLSNLTASMRFPGVLNVDINELTSTLVPFPRLHFFSTALAPLVGAGLPTPSRAVDSRLCERIVAQGFGNSGNLVRSDLRRGVHLACGVLLRGPFAVSDVNAVLLRQHRELRMAPWNSDGFKVGLCTGGPALYSSAAALCVSNNCSISEPLNEGYARFVRLYQARAHLHHYLEYIEASEMAAAAETVTGLIADYVEASGNPAGNGSVGSASGGQRR